MKRKYVARFLSLGLTAALGACLALPAGAANAPVYTGELCPVCGEGWLMETEVVMSRDAVSKAPCAHGDATATVTGETVAIDGVPVTIQYDADGRCTAVAWQGEGVSLTLEPMNISTTAATAALVDLVQAEQDALTAWAA